MLDRIYTLKEAAEKIGFKEPTIRKWYHLQKAGVETGHARIEIKKNGKGPQGRLYIFEEDLKRFIEEEFRRA